MGYSRWDNDTSATYSSTATSADRVARAALHVNAYTLDVREGRQAREVHPRLNPLGVTRESRDSAVHPASVAIGVMFDVTGSMARVPVTLQQRLDRLMSTLVARNYCTDPQVLFGAIGDAYCDMGPLQVGQFEAGIETDEDMERLWLEGGGGGSSEESYDLAYYFFARHTAIDCWEKRQKKGYLFTIGDERLYPQANARQIRTLMGDALQTDLPVQQVIDEAKVKYECFHIRPAGTSWFSNVDITRSWQQALGESRVLLLNRPEMISELIATVIGIGEGRVTAEQLDGDMRQLGVDGAELRLLVETLAPFAAERGIILREGV